MPHPGLTRPDLCSIRAADGPAEPAGAARGGLSADGRPPAGDYPPAPLSGIDRAIRLSTAAAVLAGWPPGRLEDGETCAPALVAQTARACLGRFQAQFLWGRSAMRSRSWAGSRAETAAPASPKLRGL